jgi:DNA modification methylase
MSVDIKKLAICSPKRNPRLQTGWSGFFPYYAGFPEQFAESILRSANLGRNAWVLDPWNGSGTTTYAASKLGIDSVGVDLNPVMAVVARARSLPPSEADALAPIARDLVARVTSDAQLCLADDPLLKWFGQKTARWIRALERAARGLLVGERTRVESGANFDGISAIASTYYVALFTLVHELSRTFKTSNPTWIRYPTDDERRVGRDCSRLARRYIEIVEEMAVALDEAEERPDRGRVAIKVEDTTNLGRLPRPVDFVLTSPPYCTRIDYTAATRTQLAVLWPLLQTSAADLSLRMTGTVRVPKTAPPPQESWGPTCNAFLKKLSSHSSKASSTYYLKSHLDYFAKMEASLRGVARVLKSDGVAVMVVQDSYYKDVHNDLPLILSEMAWAVGLKLERRENFELRSTLAGSHPHSRNYRAQMTATEAVMCLRRA